MPGNDGTRLRVRHHAKCGIFGRSPRALPVIGGRAKLPRPPITGKARGERPKIPHLA